MRVRPLVLVLVARNANGVARLHGLGVGERNFVACLQQQRIGWGGMPGVGDLAKLPDSAWVVSQGDHSWWNSASEASDKAGASAEGVPLFGIEPV